MLLIQSCLLIGFRSRLSHTIYSTEFVSSAITMMMIVMTMMMMTTMMMMVIMMTIVMAIPLYPLNWMCILCNHHDDDGGKGNQSQVISSFLAVKFHEMSNKAPLQEWLEDHIALTLITFVLDICCGGICWRARRHYFIAVDEKKWIFNNICDAGLARKEAVIVPRTMTLPFRSIFNSKKVPDRETANLRYPCLLLYKVSYWLEW